MNFTEMTKKLLFKLKILKIWKCKTFPLSSCEWLKWFSSRCLTSHPSTSLQLKKIKPSTATYFWTKATGQVFNKVPRAYPTSSTTIRLFILIYWKALMQTVRPAFNLCLQSTYYTLSNLKRRQIMADFYLLSNLKGNELLLSQN